MLRIAKTVYPDVRLDFNQTQACLVLQTTKDLRKFNEYCTSAKISDAKIRECLESIKLIELYKEA